MGCRYENYCNAVCFEILQGGNEEAPRAQASSVSVEDQDDHEVRNDGGLRQLRPRTRNFAQRRL